MKNSINYDFFSLKPPKEAFLIKYSPKEIKKVQNNKKIRLIFSNLDYDDDEKKAISSLKSLRKFQGLSSEGYEDDLILRYLYASNFEIDKAATRLQEYFNWRQYNEKFEPNNKILDLLETGFMYQLGRDYLFQPIIIFNLSKLDKITDFTNFQKALTYLLKIVEKYMFFPSLIEKWVLIIDCREFPKGMSFSYDDLLYLIEDISQHFVFCLAKLFIIEPNFEILTFYKGIQDKISLETMNRIMIIETKDMRAFLLRYIPSTQLEQKFGGNITNKRTYWPPKTTFFETNYSISPSKVSSKDFFQSARSSFSNENNTNVDHYTSSLVSNSHDYFFELNQKDYFYKTGEKFDDDGEEILQNFKSQSCWGPCFGLNGTRVIKFQENKKKKNQCLIF